MLAQAARVPSLDRGYIKGSSHLPPGPGSNSSELNSSPLSGPAGPAKGT